MIRLKLLFIHLLNLMAILRIIDLVDTTFQHQLIKLFGPAASIQDVCLLIHHLLKEVGDEMKDKFSFSNAKDTDEPVISYMTPFFPSSSPSTVIGQLQVRGENWTVELVDSLGNSKKERWFNLFESGRILKSVSALVHHIQATSSQQVNFSVPDLKIFRITIVPPIPSPSSLEGVFPFDDEDDVSLRNIEL